MTTMKIGVTLPSRTGQITDVTKFAAAADTAGYDSVWSYEIYRNPFTLLAGAATATSNVALGTGLAAAFSRSPFEAANAAADIDELSDGRMLLGIGTGVAEFLEAFHSSDAAKPLSRMREYIDVLRLSWEYLATGTAQTYTGAHYRFVAPPVNPWGDRPLARPQIPVYLAAMGPKLLELAGEKADGWVGYFATDRFITEFVRPNIEAGARRAGRDAADIEIVAESICCVHPDREVALHRARRQVGFYLVHPVSDRIVALHGLEKEVADLRGRMMTEGLAAFETTDERLIEAFSLTGTPDEVVEKVHALGGVVDHLALHCPYVPPITAEESADAFAQIVALRTEGRLGTASLSGSAADA